MSFKNDLVYQLARHYRTPRQVQKFLRTLGYNKKDTVCSAEVVAQKKEAHCFEGAMLAAAILEHHGYPPLIVSMESQDDLDHVIFVFKHQGKWGSVGKSREEGLQGRAPVYRTLEQLVMSYYDPYVDNTGKILAYQLIHLDETQTDWRFSRRNLWKTEAYLVDLKHTPLKPLKRRYQRVLANFKKHGPIFKQKNWW